MVEARLNDNTNMDATERENIQPALREYNIEQFTVVDVPETNHLSIISEAARIGPVSDEEDSQERFLDPRSKQSFVFDHLSLEASDPQPYEPNEEHEPIRSLHRRVIAVFSPKEISDHYVIQVVANKYNPTNFWSGRWRSEYTVNLNSKQVTGKILINVHYYEQGNVQLATTHTVSFDLPPPVVSAAPSMQPPKSSQKTFKGLRRALPLTRQKLDWDKVRELIAGTNKSAFPSSS
ncbi:F-actin-capping protein subunit alpha [Pholiota molesta]|nr:F-actin-capping protein subunit alpha [Pholiota molesta]